MDLAAGLERDGPVAVKFQLVFPAVAVIREAVRPQQQHRIDEAALRFRSHHGESSSSTGTEIARRTAGGTDGEKGDSEEDGG